ncbi:MAG: tRNA dimethylallyltransferase [Limisphaerales bacterium]|nr:MAG: tRNA dimethylallyltransferase [Limisphaerales bacterium]KAG0509875.1 MAG: tRNA dimethylallyltransferase [Limisphaerales bacterium]TXT50654.1 MAG: tRNA dimethylallyltransferase [Limisphaerales bacterium]
MHDGNARPPLAPIFLAGPTAVGKSAVAMALAELLGGEIISVDSMQVYRGLDLGTAKPSAAERARVPHHLIDVVELDEAFDAAKFVRLAAAAVKDIQGRGRVPIFCGGTGLYFKAWLEGLGEAPPADPRVRAELETTSLTELLVELERRDPETFARIDRQNPRRVVRALEVIRLTGRPFSSQRAPWNTQHATRNTQQVFCLTREPADLRARIEARVDAMFAAGLVEETRGLLLRGLEANRNAMQALGYRQVVEHLRGERGLPETVALVKTKTWQFARRQGTWFRGQLPVEWVPLVADAEPMTVARQLLARRAAGPELRLDGDFSPP